MEVALLTEYISMHAIAKPASPTSQGRKWCFNAPGHNFRFADRGVCIRFDWAKYIDKNSNSVYMMYASDIVPSYTHTLV